MLPRAKVLKDFILWVVVGEVERMVKIIIIYFTILILNFYTFVNIIVSFIFK